MANILLIDINKDDKIFNEINYFHKVIYISSEKNDFEHFKNINFNIIVINVVSDISFSVIRIINILKYYNDPEVILITEKVSLNSKQYILENNFFEIIKRPNNSKDFLFLINQAYLFWEQKIKKDINYNYDDNIFESYIGESDEAVNCKKITYIASKSDIPVLIVGKTGTGKELLANIIHKNSDRRNNKFVIVDCAALPEFLSEAILFGSKKGAYTSSSSDKYGLVTQAHGGTIFLDEIGELPISLQKILLRVLQEKKYRPIGGNKEINSDFRIICATNKDISKMVKLGEFRDDLYYRINSLVINPPVLNGRYEDISSLAFHYINKICQKNKKNNVSPTKDFIDKLKRYSWPGNVRELVNVIESCIAKTPDGGIISSKHLPFNVRSESFKFYSGHNNLVTNDGFTNLKSYRKKITRIAEKDYLKNVLIKTGGDIDIICKISGLSRSRLYELLKIYNLNLPRISGSQPLSDLHWTDYSDPSNDSGSLN
jgi:two-component system, NtrC family, response regulator